MPNHVEFPEQYNPPLPQADYRVRLLGVIARTQFPQRDIDLRGYILPDVSIPPIDEEQERTIYRAASFQIDALASAINELRRRGIDPRNTDELNDALDQIGYTRFMEQEGIVGDNKSRIQEERVIYLHDEDRDYAECIVTGFFNGLPIRQVVLRMPDSAVFASQLVVGAMESNFFYFGDALVEVRDSSRGTTHTTYLQRPSGGFPINVYRRSWLPAVVAEVTPFGGAEKYFLQISGVLRDGKKYLSFLSPLPNPDDRTIDLYDGEEDLTKRRQIGIISVTKAKRGGKATMALHTITNEQFASRRHESNVDDFLLSEQALFDTLDNQDALVHTRTARLEPDQTFTLTFTGAASGHETLALHGVPDINNLSVTYAGIVYTADQLSVRPDGTIRLQVVDTSGTSRTLQFSLAGKLIDDVVLM